MTAPSSPSVLSQRYRLERELGRGAMGVVHLASDLRHHREVAVKILGREVASGVRAERFLEEIRAVAGLTHPNILPLLDSGDQDGTLYYVMPRVRGETLAERLRRVGPLGVREAVDVARAVADALAHAHARGVVHRDVKPGNILLDAEGHVYLADFGIARALTPAVSSRLTMAGIAVGSPLYMSPEQCAGADDVDGRSDVYSLSCVLFEMLAGAPPFDGGDVQQILARHRTAPPPSLRSRRADVPPALDRCVKTGMAKDPEERFASADAMARGLASTGSADVSPPEPGWSRTPWRARRLAVVGLGLLGLMALAFAGERVVRTIGPGLDTTRIAVLPFRHDVGMGESFHEDILLRDAFGRWTGIDVVGSLQVSDAIARITDGSPERLDGEGALDVSRELEAGRYVFGLVSPAGDSARISAALYDANEGGSLLRRASIRVGPGGGLSAASFAALADSLLFGRLPGPGPPSLSPGTRSPAAWIAFGEGREALERWNLVRGDSLFSLALEHDPSFARAHLWLAQTRHLHGESPAAWRVPAERALAGAEGLANRERLLATALANLARSEYPGACDAYDSLAAADPRDFAALFGQGECRRLDRAVAPDPASPSGWAFRSSYHRAVQAYRRAFDVIPSSHAGFQAARFSRVREILFTGSGRYREGIGLTDPSDRFVAYPGWAADSLSFVPYPWTRAGEAVPPTWGEAQDRLRRMFRAIAEGWVRAFPRSPDALEAWAFSLEMVGDPGGALDAVRQARELATDPAQRTRLAASEVFLLLKWHSAAEEDVRAARRMADSLLDASPDPADPEVAETLAQVAGLLGRPARAATLARTGVDARETGAEPLPRSVGIPAAALLAFAAVGGDRDSIATLERDVARAIRNGVEASLRPLASMTAMEHPALLAFPGHLFGLLESGESATAPVARAQQAVLRGDSAGARRILREVASQRASVPAAEWGVDVVLPEAALLAALEGPAAGAAWLDPLLESLPWVQPGTLDQYYRGAVLVRAMTLRAEWAAALGDREGVRRWGTPVLVLWKDAPGPPGATARRVAGLLEAESFRASTGGR